MIGLAGSILGIALAMVDAVPTTTSDVVVHLNGVERDRWLLKSIDGQLYFSHAVEIDKRADDHVVEKFDRSRELCNLTDHGGTYAINRLDSPASPHYHLKADFTADPPTVRWAEGKDDGDLWIVEPTEKENRFYIRSARDGAKGTFLSIGEASSPRWVEKVGPSIKQVFELRPAILRETKRDTIGIAPRPTSK